MAGKRDQASHEAAITRIAEALPHACTIRAHLKDVLTSAAFKGSRRSQEFLTHIVECSLCAQWDRLKERSLGIEVFSREASYDTGGDSIVRVTASDVRKRLLQYYAESNGKTRLRIEIPAGSYIPDFTGLDAVRLVEPESVEFCPVIEEAGLLQSPIPVPQNHGRQWALLAMVLLIGCTLGAISGHFWARPGAIDPRYSFYCGLLGPIVTDSAHETELALSNPQLLLYVGSNNPAAPPSDIPVPPAIEKTLNATANNAEAHYPFHFFTVTDRDYTGMGEAMSAFNLGQLMRHLNHPLRLTEAHFLNWSAARNVHLMLLGAPHLSSWIRGTLGRTNFVVEHDSIANESPLPGEQKTYQRVPNENGYEDYGLISMARLPSGLRQLSIAGLTSAGTAGLGDFFCDPDRMRPVYEQLLAASKNKVLANWQLLFRLHIRENIPLEVTFVALRANQTKP